MCMGVTMVNKIHQYPRLSGNYILKDGNKKPIKKNEVNYVTLDGNSAMRKTGKEHRM